MAQPTDTPDWTQQYQDWHGTLPELVATANAILTQQFPSAEPITLRTARHYQTKGAVSRGDKQGRSATFGVQDLLRLVSAKKLVTEGFPLDYTSSLVSQSPAAHMAQALTPSGAKASSVVANMMHQLGTSPPLASSFPAAFSASAAFGGHSAITDDPDPWRQPTAAPLLRALRPSAPLSPVPWLHLSVDEAALLRASMDERTRAAHALLGLASRLTAPIGDH